MKLKCKVCTQPVDESVGYRVLGDRGKESSWLCSEACLYQVAPERVSPGFGAVNRHQPAMMLVPAPPGWSGPTADADAVRAHLGARR